MNRHSSEILEFENVLAGCRGFSIVDADLGGIPGFPVFYEAENLKAELLLVDTFKKLMSDKHHGLQEIPLIDEGMVLLGKEGTVLEIEQLGKISLLLNAYSQALSWGRSCLDEDILDETRAAAVIEFYSSWENPREALKVISPYFDARGRFREDEIPELREVIRSIQKIHGQIQESARRFLGEDRDIWSSNEATQRDGRVVLALRSDHRGKVQGIIHGSSNSGQTIYIEPQELLEKNNALNEARSRYHLEVHRILRRCSDGLRAFFGDLETIEKQLLRFNSVQARARYAISIGAHPAGISGGGIELRAARHPALGSKAVPINIEMSGDTRILVLSGPNTGGKTVSMKTLGLLSLMHQSGMAIPADESSLLPLFSDILVDIGDEQSIDAGLSTFSAHLRNLSIVLDGAKNNALVLLDELGSGTNPSEGSALSMAVMEHLARRQVYAMVTTHHDILKAYAFSNERMDNASVEFDAGSLKPTYNIIQGIPGESHALDIAARVNMNPEIVRRAREHISEEGMNMQQLIEDLRTRQADMVRRQAAITESEQALEERRRTAEQREQLLSERELALKEEKLLEHDGYIAESRKQIEKLIYQLSQEKKHLRRRQRQAVRVSADEAGDEESDDDLNRRTRASLDELGRRQKDALEDIRDRQEAQYDRRKGREGTGYAPGDRVRYKGSGKPVEIIEAGKKKNSWVILAGSMKMTVSEKDLELVQAAGGVRDGEPVHVEYDRNPVASGGSPAIRRGLTLDVRGMRLEEALDELQRFLDDAAVNGLQFFAVIHGKGTGVLQQGIHRYLKDISTVTQVSFAPPEDGGYGKSYVYLS